MEAQYETLIRLLLAVVAGSVVGLERTYHGRPAGFRTHILVCASSALLMQFTVYQWHVLPGVPLDTVRVDPTRLAQGIMTGIGFLGAGVIMKEGITIRGLTTAASIWMIASIGIVVGMGMYFVGFVGTVLTVGVLSVFRWLEKRTPTLRYARLSVRFKRPESLNEQEMTQLVREHAIEGHAPSLYLESEGRLFRYEMTVRTNDSRNFSRLSQTLAGMERVQEFSIQTSGD